MSGSARRVAAAGALLLVCLAPAVASSAPRDERLRSVRTFAFAIGAGDLRGDVARRYRGYDLVVVDGEEVSSVQLRALRRGGSLVLGYLDVGTIEPGRSWYPAARPYRLELWPDFGEWYAAVDRAGYRRLIVERVAPAMLRKGLDGLFLDNTDMVEIHRRQTAGMRVLVRGLSTLARARRRLLFAQNGEDSIAPLLRYYDGWNREDVSYTYSFERRRYGRQPRVDVLGAQRALRRIAGAGLLVTATDYTAAGDAAAVSTSVAEACRAGAIPFVSDIGLRRIPSRPLACP